MASIVLTFLFLFIVLKPTPDVGEFAAHRAGLPFLTLLQLAVTFSFLDWLVPSLVFLGLAAAWCFWRGELLSFLLPLVLLIALFIAINGRPHHVGTIFLAAVAAIWITWPNEREKLSFSRMDRLVLHGMSAVLVCLFSLNVWDAAVAMQRDYQLPYSGSADAARYLKQVHADQATIFGYTYGMSAVQAYFDHDILANIPTTYFHEGLPLDGAVMDLSELQAKQPDYVILRSNDGEGTFRTADPMLGALRYQVVHWSDGHLFFKRFCFETDQYFIYRFGQAR